MKEGWGGLSKPKIILGLAAFLLFNNPALATIGQPVVTYPVGGTTANGNKSTTITSTGVFQVVFTLANGSNGVPMRNGCTIQNNGTHIMYVTEGLGTSASTSSKAAQIPAGGIYYCMTPANIVLTGEIDITGTSGDAFYAAQY